MTKTTSVLYNGSCPICSREIAHYRREAESENLPIVFDDLTTGAADRYGVTPDDAARRLHVLEDGEVYSGVRLWRGLPRWRWLARVVSLPVIRQIAEVAYDHAAAPLLYALHRRRVRRSCDIG